MWNVILSHEENNVIKGPTLDENPKESGRYLCTCVSKNTSGGFLRYFKKSSEGLKRYLQFMQYNRETNRWHDVDNPNALSHVILAWEEVSPCDYNDFEYKTGGYLVKKRNLKDVIFLDALKKEEPLTSGKYIYLSTHRYVRIDGVDYDLLEDYDILELLLEEGIISYSLKEPGEDDPFALFATYIMSHERVSYAVLDVLAYYGINHLNLNVESMMGLVNTPWILEWFLKKGFRCKTFNGESTMRDILYGFNSNHTDDDFYKMAELLKTYMAWDPKYVNSFPKGDPIRVFFKGDR